MSTRPGAAETRRTISSPGRVSTALCGITVSSSSRHPKLSGKPPHLDAQRFLLTTARLFSTAMKPDARPARPRSRAPRRLARGEVSPWHFYVQNATAAPAAPAAPEAEPWFFQGVTCSAFKDLRSASPAVNVPCGQRPLHGGDCPSQLVASGRIVISVVQVTHSPFSLHTLGQILSTCFSV